MLKQIDDAYGKLESLALTGTLRGRFDDGVAVQTFEQRFSGVYLTPNRFLHDAPGDVRIGSDGKSVYAIRPDKKVYITAAAPAERAKPADWPEVISELLRMQNPGLYLALARDPSESIVEGASRVSRILAEPIDGRACEAMRIESDGGEVHLFFDAATHLLRRDVTDHRKLMHQRGRADMKTAEVTVDYTIVEPGAAVKAEQFAWIPPADAREMATAARDDQEDDGDGAMALVGKPAPDFTATGLDGKPIKFADLKGSVVVLDFWASWCGPCVQGLPALDQLARDYQARGVRVLAINQQEDVDKVRGFINSKGLTLPVALDDGSIAEKYRVKGIPQTVVIGKDGKVRNILVGFGPGSEEKLRAAIDAAIR